MADSNLVVIEIDLDDDTVTIVPPEGGIYIYNRNEVDNDRIDRLVSAGATYTVYSQGEIVDSSEIENLRQAGYDIEYLEE